MKTLHLSIIVFIIGISFVVNNNAHGCNYCPIIPTSTNVPSTFTVSTNLENYASSDKIMITAYVPSPDNNSSLTIKILGPGYNLVDLHTFSPDSNQVGYTWTVLPNGPLFYNTGNYTVLAQYGQNHVVTSFYLHSTQSLITMGYPSSPLQQIKSGIKAQDVKCNQGLQLIIKAEDGSPACVTPNTAQKLVDRGWAIEYLHQTQAVAPFDNWLTMDVRYANGTYSQFGINYTITGGNKLLEARQDALVKDLVLSLQAKNNGVLIVTIPRVLLDAKMKGQDSQFIILEDGREVDFKQIRTTITDRTLSIPFQNDTSKIDIIAAQLI